MPIMAGPIQRGTDRLYGFIRFGLFVFGCFKQTVLKPVQYD